MNTNKIPTILFSTTRGWNCGDDFILFGVRHLLNAVIGTHNPVTYNRHPDLHFARVKLKKTGPVSIANSNQSVDFYEMMMGLTCNFDNSWRTPHKLDNIDFCVFSGTPEWTGKMVTPLVDTLVGTQVPVIYLGIGVFEKTVDRGLDELRPNEIALLKRASLVTVRDATCARNLAPVNPIHLPCPALFSAGDRHKPRSAGKRLRIALSTQGTAKMNGQRIEENVQAFTIKLFQKLATLHDCSLVCHYADELWELESLLGDEVPLIYSYDPLDYEQIYDQFDLTVTTRIHGAGLCASLGIPGIVVSHSARSDTAIGFGSEFINPDTSSVDEIVKLISEMDIAATSQKIIEHKLATKEKYLSLLRPVFEQAGGRFQVKTT